jgi:hypothetical protein
MHLPIILPAPYVGQVAYSSNQVFILQIDDNVANRTVRAFCQLGDNPSFKYWVPVSSGDDYTMDWTDDQVQAAILAYFS